MLKLRKSNNGQHPAQGQIPVIPLARAQRALVVLFLAVAAWYFTWRLGTFNPHAPIFSGLLFAAELFGMGTVILHLFMTWRLTRREAPPPAPGLSVDVFVPTYNEPVDIVRRTLLAAMAMDYPHQTWLLDDGNRPQMAALAKTLGCRYLARSDNSDFKAGNLNNALSHSSADVVAVFDADHAPHRQFLTRTLGYFQDPQVAFVQTPQNFYNLDSYQHRKDSARPYIWTEQSLFFSVIQRGKDYWNAAFFCGSCALVRRQHLDVIGGFATGTVTEDLHTSIRLHAQGYRSVYHSQPLAFGIAPDTVAEFLGQRLRWGQGAMQVWRREGLLANRGLTLAQRLNYFASMATYFEGWQKAFFYFAPVFVLVSGTMPIATSAEAFLVHFIPYYLLTFWVFEEVGRGYGRSLLIEQYNLARFATFMRASLGLFRRTLKFKVTNKRGATSGASYQRQLTPQLLMLALNSLAIPAGLLLYAFHRHLPAHGLVANLIWAGINAGLAVMLLLFTRRMARQRRVDYRFPVPLAAEVVVIGGESQFVTVDDLSPAGFRFYGRLPEGVTENSRLVGRLHLPSGPVVFGARIRALIWNDNANGERYIKAAGCRFDIMNTADKDRLERFLYGSSLQWTVSGFSDRAPTPLEALAIRLRPQPSRLIGHKHWSVCEWQDLAPQAAASTDVALLSMPGPDGERFVLLSRELPTKDLQIRLHARGGLTRLRGRLGLPRRIDTPDGPLFLHALLSQEVISEWQAVPATKTPAESAALSS